MLVCVQPRWPSSNSALRSKHPISWITIAVAANLKIGSWILLHDISSKVQGTSRQCSRLGEPIETVAGDLGSRSDVVRFQRGHGFHWRIVFSMSAILELGLVVITASPSSRARQGGQWTDTRTLSMDMDTVVARDIEIHEVVN